MLTYGDMVTLILCFFIILFSMSDMKKSYKKFQQAMSVFRDSIGPLDKPNKIVESQNEFASMRKALEAKMRQGLRGKDIKVNATITKVTFEIPGDVFFEIGSSKIKEEGKKIVRLWIEELTEYDFKLEIIGHCARQAIEDDWNLSWDRAHKVADALSVGEMSIQQNRIKISAHKFYEPYQPKDFRSSDPKNARVSLVVTNEQSIVYDKANFSE